MSKILKFGFKDQSMLPDKKPQFIEAEKLIGLKPERTITTLDQKDAILYALGIGFSTDPLREEDYKYTNEFKSDFTTFPTIGVIVSKADLLTPMVQSPHMPLFSPFQILHAEHKLTLIKPTIKIDVQYQHERQLIDCADKGKNAFVLFRGSSYEINQKGERELAFQAECLLFIKGLGGFNYPGKGHIKKGVELPKRNPDYKLVGKTYPNQAFIYRLPYDLNPLHIDPDIAATQKFERPILHGLASYGTVARVVVQQILGNDQTRLKTIQTRFAGHVFPGETLDLNVWKQGYTLYYEAKTRERGTLALVGYIEIRPAAKL